jgi:uncharacterized protein
MDNKSEDSNIDYDSLTITAMRNLVKEVLDNVSKNGLPNKHHFYIGFITHYKDVEISDTILKKYPNEMTIVIENFFWKLLVEDKYFSINLSFDGVKSKLVIPFNALTSFSDPHANFHLKFPKLDYNKNEIINIQPKDKKNIINIKDFKKDK